MITAFWTDINIYNGGDIFHRQLYRDDGVNDDLFELADELICQSGTVDSPEPASWMFIITWDHVAYWGSSARGCAVSEKKSNPLANPPSFFFFLFLSTNLMNLFKDMFYTFLNN